MEWGHKIVTTVLKKPSINWKARSYIDMVDFKENPVSMPPLHSQPFIISNRPKLGIDFGLHLLILATFDPSSNIFRVGFHERPP